MRDEVAARVAWFVRTHLLDEGDCDDGADPLADREFDSLSLEQLIDFIEEEFHILLNGEDIARENFSTLAATTDMVVARRRAWAAEARGHADQ